MWGGSTISPVTVSPSYNPVNTVNETTVLTATDAGVYVVVTQATYCNTMARQNPVTFATTGTMLYTSSGRYCTDSASTYYASASMHYCICKLAVGDTVSVTQTYTWKTYVNITKIA